MVDGPEKSPEERACARALRLLARREKSRRGLGLSLARAGFASSVIRGVLDDLEARGLIDDARFCRLYLGEQARTRPRSLHRLRADLRREGCSEEAIASACAGLGEELEESVLARAAARKKLRTAGGDPERLRRLLRARGFSRRAIEEALVATPDAGRSEHAEETEETEETEEKEETEQAETTEDPKDFTEA